MRRVRMLLLGLSAWSATSACGDDEPTRDTAADSAAETSDAAGEAAADTPERDAAPDAGPETSVADAAPDAGDLTAQCRASIPGDAPNATCPTCICDHCAASFLACSADAGCTAIRQCAIERQCVLSDCLRPETCLEVIVQAGGVDSPSTALAVELATCGFDNGCGCIQARGACEPPPIAPGSADAPPELEGPYQVAVWNELAGTPLPLDYGIFYPTDAPCPSAPVVLVHGGGGTGCNSMRMAQLLASRGLVALLPSFPSLLRTPSREDGDLINELLAWTVAQSDNPASPLHGLIDGSRLGVAGHSNGGVVFYAAAANPDITAIVGWDAVAALDATPGLLGASLHLVAEESQCNGASHAGYAGAPEPKALAVVESASHCDFIDPDNGTCVDNCGAPPYDPTAARFIERYSVAWLVCLLGHDPGMAEHVTLEGRPGLGLTEQAGVITCRPAACE